MMRVVAFLCIFAFFPFCAFGCTKEFLCPSLGDREPGSPIDLNWFASVPKWYFPLWSQLHRCHTAAGQHENELKDSDLTAPACGTFGRDAKATGWGQTNVHDVAINGTGMVCNGGFPGAMKSMWYWGLTDNQTYVAARVCWDDGYATWAVISAKKVLTAEMVKDIMGYVVAKGYSSDRAFAESYDTCGNI